MTKKAHKRSNPVKGVKKRIKAQGTARSQGNRPGIPDLTDALAAAMARLKAAQISRLMGNAGASALPEETAAVGKKKARKAARKARRQAEKAARQARPTSGVEPQISGPRKGLRAAA